MTRTLLLDDTFGVRIVYGDESPHGSAISGRCQQTVRRLCAPIVEHRRRRGLSSAVRNARELLGESHANGLAELTAETGRLSPAWLYPPAELTRPRVLQIERDVDVPVASVELTADLAADLASYLGEWQRGASAPRAPAARRLWDTLVEVGALSQRDRVNPDDAAGRLQQPRATLIGHACVKLDDGRHAVIVDPFLQPKSSVYPADDQPTSVGELGRVDAILITHGHPDHFDPGTLLRFGASLPIFVPDVERETVLSIDVAARLEELGFRNVHRLGWFEEARVGDLRVVALPFYGEQPTTGEVLHPEVRMLGNTYLVETAGRRVALTVDSGHDGRGDVRTLAREAVERYGPLDVLFGGYRGFGLYPIQYVFSSVASYLTFVPESCWTARQRIMCDAHELLDVAELWQARLVVPYASGGAPWYWMRGLGARLNRSAGLVDAMEPTPDSVALAAARRSVSPTEGYVASPVLPALLEHGDAIRLDRDGPTVQEKASRPRR